MYRTVRGRSFRGEYYSLRTQWYGLRRISSIKVVFGGRARVDWQVVQLFELRVLVEADGLLGEERKLLRLGKGPSGANEWISWVS